MLSTVLMFVAAIGLSAVAGYYSVIGMTSIFAGAFIPIIIMASILEASKVIVASWLYNNWKKTPFALKAYLSIAVVILMCITSMGIFGYLSKAHIDQTAKATEGVARLEQLDVQIKRQEKVVADAEKAIEKLETAGINQDTEIQAQIDREQTRIDGANARIQPAIDEQNAIIAKEEQRLGGSVALYQEQVATIDKNLKSIEDNIAAGNVEAVQALVGVKADGNLGPATQRAIETYRTTQTAERQRLADLIATESKNITSPVIDAARAEIQRLRGVAEQEIAKSNELINRLRQQLGTTDNTQVAAEVEQQKTAIAAAEKEIATLSEQKFGLEAEYRKLEVEVGPLKYIAEMVYGNNPDANLLEKAVRGVILIIIVVFDPLAILMLIAANQGLTEYGLRRPKAPTTIQVETANQTTVDSVTDPVKNEPDPITIQGLDQLIPAISTLQSEIAKLNSALSTPAKTASTVEVPKETSTNHTISFNGLSNDLTITSETIPNPLQYEMSFEEPIVRTPVAEDDIPTVDNHSNDVVVSKDDKLEWQLIDKLPIVENDAIVTSTQSTTEFLNTLKSLHQQRLQNYTNNKTED